MKLSHLLVMTITTGVCSVLLTESLLYAGVRASARELELLTMPAALLLALVVAWPISRLFHISPLMIFSGPCPGCRTRPPGWWRVESHGKRLTIACATCGQRVDLWLTRKPETGAASGTSCVFTLRWPEFLGIWRRVD